MRTSDYFPLSVFSLFSLVKPIQTPRNHTENCARARICVCVCVCVYSYVRVSVGMYDEAVDSSASVNRPKYASRN